MEAAGTAGAAATSPLDCRGWPDVRMVAVMLAALFLLVGCGGSERLPTGPDTPFTVPVIVRVSPIPLRATYVSGDGTNATYRAAAEITVSEARGNGSVQLSQVTETTTTTLTTDQGVTLSLGASHSSSVSIQIPPGGATIQSRVLLFSVAAGETLTWSFQVSGTDAQGRPFLASSGPVPVELAVPGVSGG